MTTPFLPMTAGLASPRSNTTLPSLALVASDLDFFRSF
eukprot:SAG25_NODE_1245_length_3510_cov_1468.316431_10_plen_37_part_01